MLVKRIVLRVYAVNKPYIFIVVIQQCATINYVPIQQEEADETSVSVNEKNEDLAGKFLCILLVFERV